ncbi:MAG TPA: VOC family protein [Candidatus Methanofastidiosa archaeon]|nr:VOC family protein [Candidatus Methanofastidiosa archaeon]
MSEFVHFDLPAEDLERAAKFYSEIFGWRFEKLSMDYYFITQGDSEGALKGGMGKRGALGQQMTNFIGVKGIDEYIKRIEDAGGKIIVPKQAVPGWGHMATCQDTEGNTFGLWEDMTE